jgi:hypothetical protein
MGTCVYDDHSTPNETAAPIPDVQWSVYRQVIANARASGIRFALGGGMAVSVYTGHWRPSKDLDIYVLPEQREAMIEITRRAGLVDYFDKRPYDRSWIYRSWADDVIVDIMWAMANHKAPIDERWLACGARVNVNGEHLRVLPVEELIWDKLYVLQRDRCDWPEVLKLMYEAGPALDWEHLFGRVGDDLPLLAGVLSLFRWLCPGRAEKFPCWVWQRAEGSLPASGCGGDVARAHVDLLDRREWFAAPEPAIC